MDEAPQKGEPEKRRFEGPEVPSSEDVGARLKAAQARYEKNQNSSSSTPGSSGSSQYAQAAGMAIAWVIIIMPTAGAGIGWLIDAKYETGVVGRSLGVLIGAICAIVYAVVLMGKTGGSDR